MRGQGYKLGPKNPISGFTQGGGTIKTLTAKILLIQCISIALLAFLYTLVIQNLIHLVPFLPQELTSLSSQLPHAVSLIGVTLGLGFYGMSLLTRSVQNYVKLVIAGFFLSLLVYSYLTNRVAGILQTLWLLLTILFAFIICGIPAGGTYGVLKKNNKAVVSTGVGITLIFLLKIILLAETTQGTVESTLLFFILLVFFLELGSAAGFYSSILQRMTTKSTNHDAFSRLSSLLNHYLLHLSITMVLCTGITLIIISFNEPILSIGPREIMNIKMNSPHGAWLSATLVIASILLLFHLIPREKKDFS